MFEESPRAVSSSTCRRVGQKGGGSSSVSGGALPPTGGGWAGSSGPGGRGVRGPPLGGVTDGIPWAVRVNRQPRAWVFNRWCLRHRQHRFSHEVSPPAER